eukprot:CAMPEP_0183302210 /NCGR_PEP_ID=MMETSP0160_2-20130417/8079_1 /TAXON_ID=2839 ORGANISM="Odontella Sinensis, Strain Grunow 1884" /NCGR_SAMPLE_ID=MMETSP0160_2 /ASSEMBLY_ACC=CAM_ASM_000250 /LENGTH=492 /DNA_ID=CAMNT_0025464953 /DNA_START=388 /DNA_END=1866 /DNA_ORIENTATION=-
MADFAKRPEVTVSTMGKVHNPKGEGVRVTSSPADAGASANANPNPAHPKSHGSRPGPHRHHHQHTTDEHETKVTEEGSSRRNITRKKSDPTSGGFENSRKKQGGSGKGKWDPLDGADTGDLPPTDENDPLYDDEDAGGAGYVLTSVNDGGGDHPPKAATSYDVAGTGAKKAVYGPMLTLAEFKIRATECVREYYDSGDADEVVRCIDEMRCRGYHPEVVKRAVGLGLDRGPRERELTSRLLTCLHPTPLGDDDVEAGFTLLLDSLDELVVDVPDARAMVGSFLARAVVDEVLAPAYLSARNDDHPGDEVVERAVGLLSREHCNARLEHVWGPGDGRPVAELKGVMDQLLEEYLLSRELDEAARCVREMDAPHFHHELVKRGAKIAMEKDGLDHHHSKADNGNSADADVADGGGSVDAMAALFSFLVKNAIVSEYQVSKGISRLMKLMPDLKLDVPAAPAMLDEFEGMCREGGCLPSPPPPQPPAAAETQAEA